MQQTFKQRLDPAKYDAVHRALLAGLLSNIGHKSDAHEYTGARATKFFIFPASALFNAKPQWVVSAELVETTRLYARTCAAVRPEWIERTADHLVKRTYSDPHWNPQTGHVVAYERVTLYGLPIVPRRTVHYGPIDPKQSRAIFIKGALVDGDSALAAPFFRHNQRLIDEVQTLEAKTRQRGLLAAEEARFDFYDAKIPANIHNIPAFEKWRAQIERDNLKYLFMSRRDLLARAAAEATQESFPDTISVNGIALPLEYHFEPGHPADGVTAALPLALLNQVPAERFEWLVPGLLHEKVTALIKSLPKTLRVQFIPAPQHAQAALDRIQVGQGSLLDALATALGKLAGISVTPSDFDPATLLDHLHINFKVVDEAGKVLGAGRDLDALRRQLGSEVRQRFDALPQSQFNRDGITRWDFGDLPESVDVVRSGMTLKAYPALVEDAASPQAASLRLFDTPAAAAAGIRGGLRRLFMLQLGDSLKGLARGLPHLDRMTLHYATHGSAEELKHDLLAGAVDRALFDDSQPPPRTRDAFVARAEAGWHKLSIAAGKLAGHVDEILALHHELTLALHDSFPPLMQPALGDMKEQLSHLVPRRFVITTPLPWLPHVPRFLRAMQIRVTKLTNAGLSRDTRAMQSVRPLWQRYRDRLELHLRHNVIDPELTSYRWLLEELRVSLFAQELKTSVPVSVQRLEKPWAKVRYERSWGSP